VDNNCSTTAKIIETVKKCPLALTYFLKPIKNGALSTVVNASLESVNDLIFKNRANWW
jgi:hypothetical protein